MTKRKDHRTFAKNTVITLGHYYRDGEGVLWMDPEPIPNTSCFYLYRGGLGCREYAPNGVYLCEWESSGKRGADQSIHSRNLVMEVDKIVVTA